MSHAVLTGFPLSLWMFAAVLAVAGGCTRDNPSYQPSQADAWSGVELDGMVPLPDIWPTPTTDLTSPGCPPGETDCNGSCVKLSSDPQNCGKCGESCKPGHTCLGGKCVGGSSGPGCADGSDDQVFDQGMVGCGGRVSYAQRAGLCAAGYRPCSAAEWVSRRGSKVPDNIYWTNDNLRYNGSQNRCYVSHTGGRECTGGQEPMRVCNGHYDKFWNRCNWTNCGYEKPEPNAYFGGCQNNPSAGTLCCPN